ncbi:hypothetical protein F4821DRAFT_264103 [Hypoxylon rubiginosum]|uniref:Uncharacterized protein n=1 Tax=Hypoxylon rubiginosum TaxID=110542 RepID=A0ACC0CPC5_9PEZI|nr:hypothetical protein F4821DRAFT_264103 [Hypoxylon rubiginosum]
MKTQFSHLELEFNENAVDPGLRNMRSRFPGKDGRDPPIRGIIKEFGQGHEDLAEPLARKLFKGLLTDIVRSQELGIIYIDVAFRQIISSRFSDFSTAITIPHFLTSPELNPNLNPDQISGMEFETFQLISSDYWSFDDMVHAWNWENNGNLADWGVSRRQRLSR